MLKVRKSNLNTLPLEVALFIVQKISCVIRKTFAYVLEGVFGVKWACCKDVEMMVRDLFSLYVFLEIVGISSFVLVALFQLETGLEGAFKYLVMSSLATVFILTGLAFVFMQTGSLQYAQAWADWLSVQGTAQLYTYLAFILLISGFALKTGVVPFHSWLPDAHQSANTAVSILLSGIVIKVAGIYGFIVLTKLFPGFPPVALALRILGLLSIVVGALFALRQTHFKRLVAYSSVSQMGYILLGLSSGTTLGFLGAMVHIFNHATFKSTLFTNAAALSAQAGTLELGELGGLEKKMPVTGFSSCADCRRSDVGCGRALGRFYPACRRSSSQLGHLSSWDFME